MKRIIRVLPNVSIILSIMLITLWILDKINPMMNFLDSDVSETLLLISFVISIFTSIIAIGLDRKLDHKED